MPHEELEPVLALARSINVQQAEECHRLADVPPILLVNGMWSDVTGLEDHLQAVLEDLERAGPGDPGVAAEARFVIGMAEYLRPPAGTYERRLLAKVKRRMADQGS
jgi:hypothetical protein